MTTQRYFLGLNTGASLFGVDAALVRCDGIGADMTFKLAHFLHTPFGNELRELLRQVTNSAAPETKHLATLHRVLGESFALAAKKLLEHGRIAAQNVLCIGCSCLPHWHDADGRYPSMLNLGMTGVLAERTGLTTISDFASRDLALGGQGAPITALADTMQFHDPRENRVVIDLGTVASITWVPRDLGVNHRNVIGFQAAPATQLLDGLMRLMTNGREWYDAGGKHAVQGRCLEPLLERWMQNHYFQQRPPKCVPRWEFGHDFLGRAIEQAKHLDGTLHDVLCTMTHFVANAMVHAMRNYLPDMPVRVLLNGNGVRNGFLWHLLEQRLNPIPMETTDRHGVPADAWGAWVHAALAALSLDGVPANLPAVTGASGQRVLGNICPGSPPNWSRCIAWMARQTASVQYAAA